MSIEQELINRANSQCELCTGTSDLTVYEVPYGDKSANQSILVCGTCHEQLNDDSKIDENHWYCLNDSMWSELDAVKVVAYHMLHKLKNQDLIDMIYLEEDVKTWADKGLPQEEDEDALIYRDSNGVILNIGDTIVINKDLAVKGAGFTAKQGTAVRNISLIPNDPTHIEGRVNGVKIHLKCEFIKKM
jgi:protein PhnA